MANVNLGTAHGRVVIDYDGAGVNRAKTDLDQTRNKGLSTGRAFDKVGRGLGIAGLAVAAGIGLAVKAAANFEQKLSGIQAVTGASGAQMEQLRQKALQLGRDTQFSASEAASAMEELAKAGVPLPAILNGAADATVALAAAGGIALPRAAEIAANAMNAFGLAARDLPHVADLIAGAANASAIDVSEFGQSLSQVGAVAHSTGLSFQDTAVAIAVLGNAGIKGSDAGTSLKQMLLSLANPSKKAATLMKEIGFNAFDATGHLKPLDQIAQGLRNSMQNMTPQARNAALAIIFGSDAARAGAVFFQNGAKGVDQMTAAMRKTKAADVAKARMNNLNGSIEQLKGSVETAAIQIGEMGSGPLRSVIGALTALINKFSSLGSTTQQSIILVVVALGTLALAGAGVIKTVRYIQELVAVLKVLKVFSGIGFVFKILVTGVNLLNASLLRLAANPVALAIAIIIIAIALLVVGFILLWKRSEGFRNFWKGLWAGIKAVASAVINALVVAFKAFYAAMALTFNAIKAVIMPIWNAIWPVIYFIVKLYIGLVKLEIQIAFAIIKFIIQGFVVFFRAAWAIWTFIAPIVQAAFTLIVSIVRLALAILKLIITLAIVAIYQSWRLTWLLFKTIFNAVWGPIQAGARAAMAALHAIISVGLAIIRAIVNTVTAAIHAFFQSRIGRGIASVARAGIAGVRAAFNGLRAAYNTVVHYLGLAYSYLAGKVSAMLRVVGGIGGKVARALRGAGSWLVNAGKNIIIGLINGINSMINSLIKKISSITDLVSKFKGPPSKDKVLLIPHGQLIMQGFMHGIERALPELEKMLSSIAPVNIAPAIATSPATSAVTSQINAAVAGASPAPVSVTNQTDVEALATAVTRAMERRGLGELSIDGELVTRKISSIAGRITSQRRRTGR